MKVGAELLLDEKQCRSARNVGPAKSSLLLERLNVGNMFDHFADSGVPNFKMAICFSLIRITDP